LSAKKKDASRPDADAKSEQHIGMLGFRIAVLLHHGGGHGDTSAKYTNQQQGRH